MTVIAREFLRRFSHFKRQAQAGKKVTVTDRQGRRFVFAARKSTNVLGSGRSFYKGAPVSPDPVPDKEWKGMQ